MGPPGAPVLPDDARRPCRPHSAHYVEVVSYGEVQVLRYLRTNLSAREIAGELSILVNTTKAHQRHMYQKLGAAAAPGPSSMLAP